jgi:hypothetical protein
MENIHWNKLRRFLIRSRRLAGKVHFHEIVLKITSLLRPGVIGHTYKLRYLGGGEKRIRSLRPVQEKVSKTLS